MDSSSDADAEGEDDHEVFHEAPVVPNASSQAPPASSSKWDLASTPSDAESKPQAQQAVRSKTPIDSVPTRAARLALLSSIARASAEAGRAADEKVGLAVTAYNWVDRHIRRLDADLQKSESSLLLGLRDGTEASRGLQDALGLGQSSEMDGEGSKASGKGTRDGSAHSPALGRGPLGLGSHLSSRAPLDGASSNGFVGDMAIDPNEPKYCYCDQVSFGDMIACDNEDCPREWFHYECLGLSQPPKGRWFCLFCAPPGFKGGTTFPPNAPCLPPNLRSGAAAASGRGRMAVRDGDVGGSLHRTGYGARGEGNTAGNTAAGPKKGRVRAPAASAASSRVIKRKA